MIDALKSGGITMIPLLISSVVALAMAIERSLSLRWGVIVAPDVLRLADGVNSAETAQKALESLEGRPGPLARVIRTALTNRHFDQWQNYELVQVTTRQEMHDMERGLVVLETIAGVSPLLGLLGTVLGIVKIFTAVSVHGAGQASVLSAGIAEALVTTVTGLVIAIPTLVAYNFFGRRVDDLTLEIDRQATSLLGRLYRRRHSGV